MSRQLSLSLAAVALLAMSAPLAGEKQPDQKPRIRVWIPSRLYLVSVDLWVYSGEGPLFVPYCGKEESGREDLCTLGAHLEKKTPEGWRRAELRNGTLSGKDLLHAAVDSIPPRDKRPFTFMFSTDAFGIPPGARLRVVVDAWPNEKSLRVGPPPIQVTSPEFVCPPQ
jgi:hypothetical protein